VARELCKQDKMIIHSNFPEFYEKLRKIQPYITIQPYIKGKPVTHECSYVPERPVPHTSTFQDTLKAAGLPNNTLYSFDIELPIKRTGIILVSLPYKPTWCLDPDNFVPDLQVFKGIGRKLEENGFRIAWHHGTYRSLNQWINLMSLCDYVITQSSHVLCLSELLGKKTCVIFNGNYKNSKQQFVTYITPTKVICRPDLTISAMDNEGVDTICNKITSHLR